MDGNTIEIINTDIVLEISYENDTEIQVENLNVFAYQYATDKPRINSVQLVGNKTSADLGLAAAEDISAKEDVINKVTSLSGAVTDEQYPSAKCVKENLQNKADINLSNLSPEGQSLFASKTDTNLSNLTVVGKSHLYSLKGYCDEGELLNDEEGLADVKYYAHSTFDLSKFTVVGSPIITDDGVASRFSSSSLKADISNIDFTKPWKLQYKFNVGDEITTSTAETILRTGASNGISSVIGSTKNFSLVIYSNNSTSIHTFVERNVTLNADYTIELEFTGTSYKFSVNGTLKETYDSVATITPSLTDLYIGNNIGASAPFFGSIDLKQFSITVDGVPVFSGNKTGIDTIKPDNYTVVGTPTITDDGIASGFSGSNYLKANDIAVNSKDFEVSLVIKTAPTQYTTSRVIFEFNATTLPFKVGFSGTNNRLYLSSSGGSSSSLFTTFYTGTLLTDTIYYIKTGVNGTKAYLSYSTDNKTWTTYQSTSFSENLYTTFTGNWIGKDSGGSVFVNSSIDLNSFKIYVGGNLVYQPCLKIPYTLSKTGSKVVDSVYRTRVSDMYEQFGYAPYYTLSDTNFTLPMGEIYGMMLNQSTPHIVETYQNGTSWYRVYSDGWCEQGGSLDNITSNYTNVYLLKTFIYSNYTVVASIVEDHNNVQNVFCYKQGGTFFQIKYTGGASTKADWRACGYLKEIEENEENPDESEP